jgi:hypothetical protein
MAIASKREVEAPDEAQGRPHPLQPDQERTVGVTVPPLII